MRGRTVTAVLAALVAFTGLPAQATHGMGRISGTVVDDTGAVVRDACVFGSSSQSWVARTDRKGRYRVENLPAGTYVVSFSDCMDPPRFVPQFYDGKASRAEADEVEVDAGEHVSGIDAQVLRTGTATGRLTDADGEPLAGVCVRSRPADAGDGVDVIRWPGPMTDDGGVWRLTLAPGLQHIGFFGCDDEFAHTNRWYAGASELDGATAIEVQPGEETSDVDDVLPLGGAISGAVTNASGEPLDGICVQSPQPVLRRQTSTTTDGSFTLTGLHPGQATLSFHDCSSRVESYLHQWYEGVDDEGDATPVLVQQGGVTGGIDTEMVLGGSIAGTVTSETGASVNFCLGLADGSPWGLRFGGGWEDGPYLIGGLREGSYLIQAWDCDRGYHLPRWFEDAATAEEATPVEVNVAERTSEIDIVLPLGEAPDPAVDSVGIVPGADLGGLDTGDGREVVATVSNRGTVLTEGSDYLRIEACPVTGGGCSYRFVDLEPLEPGGEREVRFDWSVVVGAGDYEVRVWLDSRDDVDPRNNEVTTTTSVLVDGDGTGVGLF